MNDYFIAADKTVREVTWEETRPNPEKLAGLLGPASQTVPSQ